MRYIASGTVILADGERVSVEHGPHTVSFVPDDSAPSRPNEFMVPVPHGYGLGRISTSTLSEEGEFGKFTLRVIFIPGGARGELVSANYSLFDVS